MSYPSIVAVLDRRGIADIDAATEAELDAALLEAFRLDLPLGMAYVEETAAGVRATGERVRRTEDPGSPLGKQIARLAGTDIARGVLERELGVAFGFYNCCCLVAAPTADGLAMTAAEQIKLQNGVFASADC